MTAAKKKKTFKFWFEGQKYEFTTILTRINETKTEFRRWRWENMGGTPGEVSFDDDIFEDRALRFWSLTFAEGEFLFELKFPMFKYINGWKEEWDFTTPAEVTVWRDLGNDNVEPYKEDLNWDDLKTKPKTPSLKKVKELRAKLENMEGIMVDESINIENEFYIVSILEDGVRFYFTYNGWDDNFVEMRLVRYGNLLHAEEFIKRYKEQHKSEQNLKSLRVEKITIQQVRRVTISPVPSKKKVLTDVKKKRKIVEYINEKKRA